MTVSTTSSYATPASATTTLVSRAYGCRTASGANADAAAAGNLRRRALGRLRERGNQPELLGPGRDHRHLHPVERAAPDDRPPAQRLQLHAAGPPDACPQTQPQPLVEGLAARRDPDPSGPRCDAPGRRDDIRRHLPIACKRLGGRRRRKQMRYRDTRTLNGSIPHRRPLRRKVADQRQGRSAVALARDQSATRERRADERCDALLLRARRNDEVPGRHAVLVTGCRGAGGLSELTRPRPSGTGRRVRRRPVPMVPSV